TSSHGFRSPLWKAPAGAVFGIARAVAATPYPYEAGPARTFWQAVVGVTALTVAVVAARREPPPLGWSRRTFYALVVPYALFGLLFFPSESERWLFLLPIFWMWAAPALARAPVLAASGLSVLLLFNVAFGLLPLRSGFARAEMRAARAALAPGDVVV